MAPAMKSAMKSKAMKKGASAKAMTKTQLADQLATKSELKKKDCVGPDVARLLFWPFLTSVSEL